MEEAGKTINIEKSNSLDSHQHLVVKKVLGIAINQGQTARDGNTRDGITRNGMTRNGATRNGTHEMAPSYKRFEYVHHHEAPAVPTTET